MSTSACRRDASDISLARTSLALAPQARKLVGRRRPEEIVVDDPRRQVAEVGGHVAQRPLRRPVARFGRVAVNHREQRHVLALRAELLRHLQRHDGAAGIPTQQIRPFGRSGPDRFEVAGGHGLDIVQRLLHAIGSLGPNAVDGLIRRETLRQTGKTHDLAANPVDEEERTPDAARLKVNQRRPRPRPFGAGQHLGEPFDRRRLGQGAHRKAPPEYLLDLRRQPRGEQRVPAEIEEIVVDADLP